MTWRDTKTAILIFNRAKNITSTIENVGVTLSEHPNFKRKLDYQTDRGFRCTLGHRNDPSRELVLTVLVFDVPTESHHSGEESPS